MRGAFIICCLCAELEWSTCTFLPTARRSDYAYGFCERSSWPKVLLDSISGAFGTEIFCPEPARFPTRLPNSRLRLWRLDQTNPSILIEFATLSSIATLPSPNILGRYSHTLNDRTCHTHSDDFKSANSALQTNSRTSGSCSWYLASSATCRPANDTIKRAYTANKYRKRGQKRTAQYP